MKSMLWKSLIALIIVSAFVACEDKNKPDNEKPGVPALTQKVNNFIMDYATEAYLWNTKIPTGIDTKKEEDPFALMEKIIYKEYDRWTYLTDDADALFKDYEGVSTTYGYRLTVYKFSNADSYFGIVRFIYPNSPAEKAGLERGDILLMMNDKEITEDNYLDLYYSSGITLQTGKNTDDGIALGDKKVSMQAVEMYLDPVNTNTVIDKGAKRIGYLCYTDYVEKSHDKLVEVFKEFKRESVTDVVLDLRYNPGGASLSVPFLSSILAPKNVVEKGEVCLEELWNDGYMAYFKRKGEDRNEYFQKNIGVNMDLSHLYVLTSKSTASASEATMVSLMPYMDVIQIGEPTHGKYCGAALLRPMASNDRVDAEIGNWAMSLVIYKFANKNGLTDFKDGLTPTFSVTDDWMCQYPLGDERDPMLAKAIEVITGEPAKATSRSSFVVPGEPLPAMKQPDYNRGGMISDYR